MNRPLYAAALAALCLLPTAAPAAEPPGDVQDLIYVGPPHPVRLRFHLVAEGHPPSRAWERFVKATFEYFDRDGDGGLDAKELALFAQMPLRGRAGRIVIQNGQPVARTDPLEFASVDTDKDGTVSPDEFMAYLRRTGLGPVAVNIRQPNPEAQRLTDALFKHLDRDGDGKLSRAELALAGDSLAALDQDEDEIVTAQELLQQVPPNGLFVVAPSAYGPVPAPNPPRSDFLVVTPDAPPVNLARQLIERLDKDKSGALSRAEFGVDAGAFRALDRDGNGSLDADELAAWLKGPADLAFQIDLGPSRGGLRRPARVQRPKSVTLVSREGEPAPLAKAVRTGTDETLRLVLPDLLLNVSPARDDGTRIAFAGGADGSKQQFMALAGDKGFVEKKQLAMDPNFRFVAPMFDAADRDGNGKLTFEEYKRYFDLLSSGTDCQAVLTVNDQGRGLFDLLDADLDRRLSPRELRNAAAALRQFDRDGDGAIARDELPKQYVASATRTAVAEPFARGRFVVALVSGMGGPPVGRPTRGPAWFRKMDRNGDGDVSAREFLGPPELFRKLDLDGDGLLSADEAEAADKLRPKAEGRGERK